MNIISLNEADKTIMHLCGTTVDSSRPNRSHFKGKGPFIDAYQNDSRISDFESLNASLVALSVNGEDYVCSVVGQSEDTKSRFTVGYDPLTNSSHSGTKAVIFIKDKGLCRIGRLEKIQLKYNQRPHSQGHFYSYSLSSVNKSEKIIDFDDFLNGTQLP